MEASGVQEWVKIHRQNIDEFCRICGSSEGIYMPNRKPVSKSNEKYLEPLQIIYGIDAKEETDDEVDDIYPKYICFNSCRRKLDRYIKSKKEQRHKKSKDNSKSSGDGLPIDCEAFDFHDLYLSHKNTVDENCKICSLRRSPRKRTYNEVEKIQSETDQSHSSQSEDITNAKRMLFENKSSSSKYQKITTERPSIDHDYLGLTQGGSSSSDLNPEKLRTNELEGSHMTQNNFNSLPSPILNSIPVEKFVDQEAALAFQCSICLGVPTDAVMTPCFHSFCGGCIDHWLKLNSVCPVCRTCVEACEIVPFQKVVLHLFSLLKVSCKYKANGCSECFSHLKMNGLENHERDCSFKEKLLQPAVEPNKVYTGGARKKTRNIEKQPLLKCNKYYIRHDRLKPTFDFIDSWCNQRKENKTDVLFFNLWWELKASGDKERAAEVKKLWENKISFGLSPAESLAIRIETLQNKYQYKKQYDILKAKGETFFSSPNSLDSIESTFLPGFSTYTLEKDGKILVDHKPEYKGPVDVLSSFQPNIVEFPVPNLCAARWNYCDALAKSLEELHNKIREGLVQNNIDPKIQNFEIETVVKDGADGMGDVSEYNIVRNRSLPSKAYRYVYAILKCTVSIDGKESIIFEEHEPNSVRSNRPLLQSVCDENETAALVVCLCPIEKERTLLKQSTMTVKGLKFKFRFVNSESDEKHSRHIGGLQGSGSNNICDLCTAGKQEAKDKVGSFKINRDISETFRVAELMRTNPEKLNQNAIKQMAQGVKSTPLSSIEHSERYVDATHADINMGSFFKKVIVREVAQVTQWEATSDVKPILQNAEFHFDSEMKRNIGICPSLMLPGNYARKLFETESEPFILNCIEKINRKDALKSALEQFRVLRKIYRAKHPLIDYPNETKLYKQLSVQFGKHLIDNFSHCEWPNYLHKIIEHVDEIIEREGSIGIFASEGNEAGNKLFRHIRKHHARKNTNQGSLEDTLKMHTLYCSKALQSLAYVANKKYQCSKCGDLGHNRITCRRK